VAQDNNKVRLAYAAHGGVAALGWWGWWGFGGYAGVIAEIYAVARKVELFPDFTYHFEIDGYTYEQFAASRDPEVKKGLALLRKLVKTGRVEIVGGTYAGPFAPLCDSESMVRHFEYGLAATQQALGVRPTTYYSQEPNYSLQSPRVFRDFGYRDVLLRFEYNAEFPKFDAEKVTWVGLDGTTVDAVPFYYFNDGSFCHNPPSSGSHMPSDYLKTGRFGKLGTPRQYLAVAKKHGVANPLVLFCRDVTHYHFTDQDARRVRKSRLVSWTTLKDQCRRAAGGDRVALKADDIKPVARFGWLGDRVRQAGRRAVRALYSAEFLDAAEVALGVGPARGELDEVWKRTLIADNHDALFYNHGMAFLQQDGTDLAALRIVESAEQDASMAAQRKLSAIARCLRKPRKKGVRVIVANTLPWTSQRVAEATVDLGPDWQGVTLADGSEEIEAEILDVFTQDDGTRRAKVAFPCHFEGAGYKCFYVTPGRPATGTRTPAAWSLESASFSLSLDPKTGAVTRLLDKKSCLEYEGPLNLYKAYFTQLGCWSIIENVRALSATRGASGVRAVLEGDLVGVAERRPPLGDREEYAQKHPDECPFPARVRAVVPFRLLISLDDVARAVGFQVTFDFPLGTQIGKDFYGTDIANIQAQMDRAGYALRALFALPKERRVWADVPFGAAERHLPVFPGVNWCRAEFEGKALTLVNEGTVGYTNDQDGLGNMLAMASSGVHGSSTKDRFLYAYISGRHTYRYWLITDPCSMGPSQVTRKALELTTPLLSARAQGSSGPLPEESTLLQLSDGVVPTSVREKDGVEIRLHEAVGAERDLEVKLHNCFAGNAHMTSLDGHNTQPLGEARDKLSMRLSPWQVVTLKIEQPKS